MTTNESILTRPMAMEVATLVLRVWLGTMMITHGYGKVFGGVGKLTGSVEKMGFPAPELFAWAAALSEFGGGILLILGLFVRPVSLFVAFTMFVAGFIRHADDPFGKKELSLTYLAIALFFFLMGPGRYSLDHLLWRKKKATAV